MVPAVTAMLKKRSTASKIKPLIKKSDQQLSKGNISKANWKWFKHFPVCKRDYLRDRVQ